MARYAIGDIHGCVKTFRKLVEDGLKLTKGDTLYLLGDLVNKGPDSMGVLDYVLYLLKKKHNVLSVRGNHDQMFLDAYYGKIADYWITEHAKAKTLKSFGVTEVEDIPVIYFDYIKDMPYFLELDNCFLVHAGFNFSLSNPFMDFKAMLHTRKFKLNTKLLKGKRLIHGHVPIDRFSIEKSVKTQENEINLDGGCVYYLNEGLGYLMGFNIDTLELAIQENIDIPYPIDIKR